MVSTTKQRPARFRRAQGTIRALTLMQIPCNAEPRPTTYFEVQL
ncbi:hypothetical protein PBI_GAGEAP_87 [Mycobacterium phage GageAP]|nr:hypothetical protein PBI_GAGEAP_87 [Mycobacterium phage GageAP]AYD81066.1 hypothetical protein SEA_ARCANINE_91 [Mycobacterium phage Arcanine]WGH20288.1 hypothetical protein SLAGATHOR_88 [Mycobacterium phage Slagathor]